MRKKCLLLLFVVSVLLGTFSNVFSVTANAEASSAEMAMELTTGEILSQSNAEVKLPMASTTKVMTAIIIIEDCNLEESFIVPEESVGVEGSSIYLRKDEEISVKDLLYGLMLRSGNDSATALAIHHSGSVEKFVEVMNERAKKIGAQNTSFKNPSGLPAEGHYTTAHDLCLISCYGMRNRVFKEIVSTENYKGKYRSYVNKNKMLYNYEGANGVKTGYTLKAGRCLVSSAERNGMDVVCVVLNCPDMYKRSAAILDECFKSFKLINLSEEQVFMSDKILCKLDKSYSFIAKNAEELTYKVISIDLSEKIKQGDKVGKLEIYVRNSLIFCGDLYSI